MAAMNDGAHTCPPCECGRFKEPHCLARPRPMAQGMTTMNDVEAWIERQLTEARPSRTGRFDGSLDSLAR